MDDSFLIAVYHSVLNFTFFYENNNKINEWLGNFLFYLYRI